jgi:hypothetical protein
MNAMSRSPGAAWCAVLGAMSCQGTHLGVMVRAPGEKDVHANVRLVLDERTACDGTHLFAGRTNAEGELHVVTEACGRTRLIVSRRGKRTVEQLVDTCEQHGIEVVLWPAQPARPPVDACAEAALQFLRAWLERDELAARALWAGPKDFASIASDASYLEPWSIDVAPSQLQGQLCSVETRHFYEQGCDETWRVDLEQLPEGWRVRALDRTDPPLDH